MSTVTYVSRAEAMAAYKAGIKTVIIPFENEPDLEEVDDTVKKNVSFIPAKTIETVLDNALAMPNTGRYGKEERAVKQPVIRKERAVRKNIGAK